MRNLIAEKNHWSEQPPRFPARHWGAIRTRLVRSIIADGGCRSVCSFASSIAVKRKIVIAAVVIASIAVLPFSLYVCHLGPLGIKPGDDVLCSQLELPTGTKLYVIATRNPDWGEPYTVNLYRVETNQDTYAYRLGDEDSFWWGSSLRFNGDKTLVEIRSFGQYVAKYTVGDKTVVEFERNSAPNYGHFTTDTIVRKALTLATGKQPRAR
jgi:hypothetical protein